MHDQYQNPLTSRYASAEMAAIWSDRRKIRSWRQLWVALAEAQQELGLDISDAQLEELRANIDNVDFERAAEYEQKLRHDVMAHLHAYGDDCPGARGIIHLGATSCFVTDNTDLMLLRESLELIRARLALVIDKLGQFAQQNRSLPCLGFTHMQPAQPTTVGKRACLWCYDLACDLDDLQYQLGQLKARSTKGTTGTQASFLDLFDGDHGKVKALEQRVTEKMGFQHSYQVTGQTYSRKVDSQLLDLLSRIAQSAHKAATDIRLLAHRKEVEEPFGEDQVGSSAMAYKRNPMRSERICSLARFVISLQSSTANTAATQWMERSLDDSANRRLVLPQALLAIDAILVLYQNVASGLETYPQVIARNLRDELPFMATENILMAAVRDGGDRQDLHERIRQHSQEAAKQVKQDGAANDLLERLAADEAFSNVDLESLLDPALFVGRSAEQVDEFLAAVVEPIRQLLPSDQPGGDVNV